MYLDKYLNIPTVLDFKDNEVIQLLKMKKKDLRQSANLALHSVTLYTSKDFKTKLTFKGRFFVTNIIFSKVLEDMQ